MQVFERPQDATWVLSGHPVAVTFGVFDGVHLGHQDLIHRAVEWGRGLEGRSVVVTFAEHPLRLLAPGFAPPVLTPRERKLALIAEMGVDVAVVVEFTRQFADQTPEEFVQRVLVDALRARAVFFGFNSRFGKGGAGDAALLQRMGADLGFEVTMVPPTLHRDAPVSSTRVREMLQEGRVRRARELLGRPHMIEGVVVEGAMRGRSMGFPTANLHTPPDLLMPCGGVYAVRAHVAGKRHGGMMNIGVKPTFEPGTLTAEVNLFDFDSDIYGQTLGIEFIERMRSEKRFASVDELRRQLEKDKMEAVVVLAQEP